MSLRIPVPLPLILTLLALLAGCRSGPDWATTRSTCGLEPGETRVVTRGSIAERPISTACAERLGLDFGIDWPSFETEPHPVSSTTHAVDALVVGLYAGLAGDFGTIGALVEDPGQPAWLRETAEDLREDHGLDPSDPAAQVLYLEVASGIHSIVYAPDLDAEARINGWTVRLGSRKTFRRGEPIAIWALLAHEAGHWQRSGHDPCPNEDGLEACDPDSEGPLGFEVSVADLYQQALPEAGPHREHACLGARQIRASICQRILVRDTLAACSIEPVEACTLEASLARSE